MTIRYVARSVFVTGVAGFLGAEVARRAARQGWRVSGTTYGRPAATGIEAYHVDVRDGGAVRAALEATRPDVVVHTAYRRDDAGVTVDGARHVAEAAARAGARLIHMSSDLVFSGRLGRPLTEDDRPDPVMDYGRWKARAEELVAEAHPAALIVRTSLIYGEEPSGHERLALAAADGEDVTFFTDELRNPIDVSELVASLLQLATKDVRGPLHVAGRDAMDRLEFARLLVARRGGDPTGLRGGAGPEDRPKDCRLDSSRARELLRT